MELWKFLNKDVKLLFNEGDPLELTGRIIEYVPKEEFEEEHDSIILDCNELNREVPINEDEIKEIILI